MPDESMPVRSPGPRRRRRTARAVALAVVGVLVAGMVVAAVTAWSLLYRPEHDVPAGKPAEVVLEKGMTTSAIAEELVAEGVVANALRFRVSARSAGADGDLRAGTYQLETGMTDDAVIARLKQGPPVEFVEVPIPEGFTAKQVAARVAKRTGISKDELLALMTRGAPELAAERPYLKGAYRDSLEGYLFPATYRVKEGASARQVVDMMLDKFEIEMARIDLAYARSKNLTPADVVNVASMIEREARLAKERKLISSVIYNRLKRDMRLQLCATVLYEMPPGTTRLTYADLESRSPYNTYRIAGLPPGPISNPGRASLEAAARPSKTDYLYYVLTGEDGSHTFTSDYGAFQRAVVHSRVLTAD